MSETDFNELARSLSNDELRESLREIRISLNSINRRISYLEEKEVANNDDNHGGATVGDGLTSPRGDRSASTSTIYVGAAYASVKASVQAVKLPADLIVSHSRPQGLQKTDQRKKEVSHKTCDALRFPSDGCL
jgi:hypothetical protein